MESGSVKRTSRDRLSELPDEILVNILSFLPTLDAVKTLLLRRFGNLWTLVHSLSFSDCSFGNHINAEKVNPAALSLFSKFVTNALLLHKRHTIKKFHLEIHQGIPEIEMWLRFVLSREVEELTLNIYHPCRESCILPYYVFKSRSLVSLEVIGFRIMKPTRVHMESLRKLTIDPVEMDGEILEESIYGSRSFNELVIPCYSELSISSANVESLKLTCKWGKGTIHCPNLKKIYICAHVHCVEITDVSSISEAEVHISGLVTKESAPMYLSFFEKMGNAEVMKLSHHSLHNLTYSSSKQKGFPQNSWKHLILLSWVHEIHMMEIESLLRKSPCLEELTIHPYHHHKYLTLFVPTIQLREVVADHFRKHIYSRSPCKLPQLKTVTMHGFKEGLLELARFILRSAFNLEKLRFVSEPENLTPAGKVDFITQVESFTKVSAKARVVFE